ncbi:hypothetical protein, partial [Stenotrophomonas maltophilia]|uniref:hypothetical protein n=1 Tax=Stenotrophomonas maltophilia TaxID=40324 RepID=UPI001C65A26B
MAKAKAVSGVGEKCRAEPVLGWVYREQQPSMGSALQRAPCQAAFALLFFFPWVDAHGNCQRPG